MIEEQIREDPLRRAETAATHLRQARFRRRGALSKRGRRSTLRWSGVVRSVALLLSALGGDASIERTRCTPGTARHRRAQDVAVTCPTRRSSVQGARTTPPRSCRGSRGMAGIGCHGMIAFIAGTPHASVEPIWAERAWAWVRAGAVSHFAKSTSSSNLGERHLFRTAGLLAIRAAACSRS